MATPYNAVRISGTLPGGEVWSVNPKFGLIEGGAIAGYPELLAWAASVAGINGGSVFPSNLRQILSSVGAITSVRTEYYDATGKLGNAAEMVLTTPSAGLGTPSKTFSDAVCVSLLSGRPGRSYRGRLYFPAIAINLTAGTLRISATLTQTLATEVAAWLDTIADSAAAGAAVRPMIVSQTQGFSTPITAVRVGDVLDTQRRRRDSLQEAYSSAPIPV